MGIVEVTFFCRDRRRRIPDKDGHWTAHQLSHGSRQLRVPAGPVTVLDRQVLRLDKSSDLKALTEGSYKAVGSLDVAPA
jgi:hypothetical protein